MSEQKKKTNVMVQIAAALLIALLAGGTAPWWWKELFPPKPNNLPEQTPPPEQNQQESEAPPQAQTPEDLSRTDHSLPGDAILHFRVVERKGRSMTIEVDYRYNALHGDKVMVGAWLKGVSSGYRPAFVPSPRKSSAPLQISINEPGISTDLEIFLYEWGRPSERFAYRIFPIG